MRDMKQNSSVDQCKGCTLRGDITACEAVECSNHDNWYPQQLKAELEQLRAKAAAFDLIDGQEIETYYPTNEDMTLKIFPLGSVIGGEEYRGKTLLEAVNNARGES